jgi:protein-tyrosine phosphatase
MYILSESSGSPAEHMLDIHCHILPGVDDGPQTLAEALTVARLCVRDGITHITATPHCHRHLRLFRDAILPHVAEFNEALRNQDIALQVLPGSEIQLEDVELYRREYLAGLYCHLGDDPAFTLLEFSWQARRYPAAAPEHVRWLRAHGTRPIVAHPERHSYFQEQPDRLSDLVEAEAWLQVTVDSLLGNHGPQPQEAGWRLLEMYPDVVLATDAHRPERCSGLSRGYRLVGERLGAAREEDLRARADHILQHLLQTGHEWSEA